MLSFNRMQSSLGFLRLALCLLAVLALGACQFQPLHGSANSSSANGNLASIGVASVNTRVGQQVRNNLLFLLNGGNDLAEKTHEARLRVSSNNRNLNSIRGVADSTSGTVTVSVTYDLVELSSGEAIASGSRQAIASYDRTGQVFANKRALRDAENRASREAAEAIRLAIASALNRR